MIRIPCLLAATSLFLFSSSGCSSLSLPRFGETSKASVSTKPSRCLCLWQPVQTEDANGQPVQGFGGQVYFFEAGSEEPVEVEGDVRVFVFDDVGTPEQQARPKDVKDFDSFVWKSFRNKSQVGTNYALFVPYDKASQYDSICSLRLRLVQPDGAKLFSDMATVKLAGEPREDKSIRQLVSPRERSISPERSRELRVDLQQPSDSSDRSATIGSIQEGNLSLQTFSAISDQSLDDHARLKIQRYEARLAEMHAEYERANGRRYQESPRNVRDEISDLLPAIRKVSHDSRAPHHQQVTPAAHEVFSDEEPLPVQRADYDDARSRSSIWNDNRSEVHSGQTSNSTSDGRIKNFSQPLSRRHEPAQQPVWSDDSELQALQLARIAE
jgi:hypothetical protein